MCAKEGDTSVQSPLCDENCDACLEKIQVQGSKLSNVPVPERSKPEGFEGGRANAVGAAIDAEEEPAGLAGGDEIATAVRTRVAVTVVLLHVPADLLGIVQDLASWCEKKIFSNHVYSASLHCGLNLTAPGGSLSQLFPRSGVDGALPPGLCFSCCQSSGVIPLWEMPHCVLRAK